MTRESLSTCLRLAHSFRTQRNWRNHHVQNVRNSTLIIKINGASAPILMVTIINVKWLLFALTFIENCLQSCTRLVIKLQIWLLLFSWSDKLGDMKKTETESLQFRYHRNSVWRYILIMYYFTQSYATVAAWVCERECVFFCITQTQSILQSGSAQTALYIPNPINDILQMKSVSIFSLVNTIAAIALLHLIFLKSSKFEKSNANQKSIYIFFFCCCTFARFSNRIFCSWNKRD